MRHRGWRKPSVGTVERWWNHRRHRRVLPSDPSDWHWSPCVSSLRRRRSAVPWRSLSGRRRSRSRTVARVVIVVVVVIIVTTTASIRFVAVVIPTTIGLVSLIVVLVFFAPVRFVASIVVIAISTIRFILLSPIRLLSLPSLILLRLFSPVSSVILFSRGGAAVLGRSRPPLIAAPAVVSSIAPPAIGGGRGG